MPWRNPAICPCCFAATISRAPTSRRHRNEKSRRERDGADRGGGIATLLWRGYFRIASATPETLRTDLVKLGNRLGWVRRREAQDAAVARVVGRLRRDGDRILLIFDNAPGANAITPFLPRGGAAHVLITSNAHDWSGVADAVEIRLWPKQIGTAFLLARTGQADVASAEARSKALDGLPLAHEMAGAYCEQRRLALDRYLARFSNTPAKLWMMLQSPRSPFMTG